MRVEWRLPAMLAEQQITLRQLHRLLHEHGYVVNYSTVWRDVNQTPSLLGKLVHYCAVLDCTLEQLIVVREDKPLLEGRLSLPPPLHGPGP